jgi:hypothetical protein
MMKKILLLMLLFNYVFTFSLTLENLPPINNIYKTSLKVPLLGKQDIYLERKTKNTASLKMNGIVNTNGKIFYHKTQNNDYDYTFDENINNVLNKYKVTMYNVDYDNENDISKVDIKIRLLNFKKQLIFQNIDKQEI